MPIHAPEPALAGRMLAAALKDQFAAVDRAIHAAFVAATDQPGPGDRGGREFALARTNLEQASMWATKALCVAFPEEAQE